MKPLNIVMAVVGGAIAGAALGLLFAPDKGVNTRKKIVDSIKKRGLKLEGTDLDALADEIASEIDSADVKD